MTTPEPEFAELRDQLRQVSSRLQRLEADQHAVRADHDRTVKELHELVTTATDRLTVRNEEDREQLRAEVRADVAALRSTVDHLGRVMRRMDGETAVDFTPDAPGTVLAHRVIQGLQREAERLDESARAARTADVRAWETWERDDEHHRGAALAAGAAVVGSPPGRARRATERRFRAALQTLGELAARRDDVRFVADAARRALAADDDLHHRYGPDITAGREARAELVAHYTLLVNAMNDRDALAPEWFTRTLGAPSGDGEEWRAMAVDVLVYRAVFAVFDPVTPLGHPPDGDASPQRRAWHADLASRLAARG